MSQPPAEAAPVFGHQRTALGETEDASGTDYILIQTDGLIQPQDQQDLRSLGVEFLELLGNGVYLCRYLAANLDVIRSKPYTKHVDVYRPQFKVHASTQEAQPAFDISGLSASAAPDAPPDAADKTSVAILLHQNLEKSAEQVAQELISAKVIEESETAVTPTQILTQVKPSNVSAIADNDSVKAIEPEKEMQWRDARARSTLNAVAYRDGIVTPNGRLSGENQIIAVVDSGFDKGIVGPDMHPAFTAKRILTFFKGATEVPKPGSAELQDTSGHGTHCIGCAAGGPIQLEKDGPITSGMAPEANLIIGVKDAGQGTSERYLEGPYSKGARIFSMSWGPQYNAMATCYDNNADAVDKFAAANPEALICWAAGNDGEKNKVGRIISQAAAKNVLTVGNCNSERPVGTGPTTLINDSDPAQSAYVMEVTSSTGPTAAKMIKPDIVAPGMRILAARSKAWDQTKSAAYDNYPDAGDLIAMSGTSQATPLAAGCVALLRQALAERKTNPVASPSAALMRALIVNGAVQLTPGTRRQYNFDEGFGRLNLAGTLAHLNAQPGWADFQQVDVPFKDTYPIRVQIPPKGWKGQPNVEQRWHLRVTLVWTDVKGAVAQNVLILKVQTENETRYGNVDAPTPGQAQELPTDTVFNTVQRLDWFDMAAGDATINISYSHQVSKANEWPCAVVWRLETCGQ